MSGMGDIEGLIDKVSELKLDDNEELMKKLKQGKSQISSVYSTTSSVIRLLFVLSLIHI